MITIMSWGHKFGNPPANIKFDASYLINPWRKEELKNASKNEILEFMKNQKEFKDIVNMIVNSIEIYNKLWPDSIIICAVCCSEGSYRSPMVVESVAKILDSKNIVYKIKHQHNER